MNAMPNTGRIWVVFVALTLVGMGVFARILMIQTVERRAGRPRGRVLSQRRTIAPARGQILAEDGSLLATSVPVYDLRWDAKCEGMRWDMYDAYVDTLCQELGASPGKQPSHSSPNLTTPSTADTECADRSEHSIHRFPVLRDLPFIKLGRYKSGLVFERKENRRGAFGKLAARTVGIDREHQRVGLERAWNDELAGVEGQQLSRKVAGNQWMPVTDDFLVDPVEGMDVVTSLDLHLQRRGHQCSGATTQKARRGLGDRHRFRSLHWIHQSHCQPHPP